MCMCSGDPDAPGYECDCHLQNPDDERDRMYAAVRAELEEWYADQAFNVESATNAIVQGSRDALGLTDGQCEDLRALAFDILTDYLRGEVADV